jgi:tRNA(Ile2) C34 agmatinyltransferase TiaS
MTEGAVSGTTCPTCGGRLEPDGTGQFTCEDCGDAYDVTEMFMP